VVEGAPRPGHRNAMQRHEFRAMGSKMLALLDAAEPSEMLDSTTDWLEEWEQALSRFRIDSELTELNSAAGQPVAVSPTMWEVIRASLRAQALTQGLVNPLILESLVVAGYDRPFDLLDSASIEDATTYAGISESSGPMQILPDLHSIVVDEASRLVRVPEGLGLDFGGVAKGWAAHQAMLKLRTAGPALFSAGGDVAVSGPLANGDPWEISVEDPFHDGGFIETLYLEHGGVATSGQDHRHWQRGGRLQHHIIDPRTREPAVTDVMAATVVASSVMRAEALAKAVMISGSEQGMALVDEIPDAETLIVLQDGRMLYSQGIEEYL
jgi:thiamine biosynthesis lipoprotein